MSTPDCYGCLLPDVANEQLNTWNMGHIIKTRQEGHGIGVPKSRIEVDHEAFEKCRECPRYEACRDLGFAITLTKIAVK